MVNRASAMPIGRRALLLLPAMFAAGAIVERRAAAGARVVYIGTYTGDTSQGIYAFRFDDGSGALTPLGLVVGFEARNRFLIAADKGLDRLLVFRFDASGGGLVPNQPPSAALPAGAGPRHYAFHPNGKWLFAINELAATITMFSWDEE